MTSTGAPAEAARRGFAEMLARPGHAVDNARAAAARLDAALAAGHLQRSPELDQALADLERALEQDDGQKLGGKSAEAARFIGRYIERLLADA